MAQLSPGLYSLNSGVVSDLALARVDLARLRVAAEVQENLMPTVLGPARFRPGTEYLVRTQDDIAPFGIPFVVNTAIKALVDFRLIAKSKLRFAHDALFGVGAGCFEELLAGTTCRVTTLNAEHNPLFGGINPEPIAKNYAKSAAFLAKNPHDLCLVTDGDAGEAEDIGAGDEAGLFGGANDEAGGAMAFQLRQHLVEFF